MLKMFIHASVCLMPIVCKTLTKSGVNKDIIETICAKIYNAVKIPLVIMFSSLVIATSATLIYAIIRGYLNVPFIFVILNPLGLMLIGWMFRLINKRVFSDLPGIIMPSRNCNDWLNDSIKYNNLKNENPYIGSSPVF